MAALSVVSTPPRAASASKEIAPRPAQQLPRASQVVPSQVAAFSKGAQLAPAPPVTRFSTPASEASAMGTPARASGVFPLMSTSSNLSEVMHPFPTSMSLTPGLFSQALQPFPTSMSLKPGFLSQAQPGPLASMSLTPGLQSQAMTPLPSSMSLTPGLLSQAMQPLPSSMSLTPGFMSQAMPAMPFPTSLTSSIGHSSQVPSAALPLLNPASATPPPTGYLPKVPSSPSEPDPMMWSEGVRSLGDYMAAKAMGNLPEEMRRIPTPMTMFSAPTTFFDVSTEKDGLQLKPLPPLNEEDPSKDMPEYPTEPEKLTIGLVEPEAVERCRDRYTEELDGQLLEATRAIERANAEKKTRLRQEFFQMREQYNNEVENELLEQARIVVEKYHDRLAVLQEEADRQRRRLDREADTLLQESQRYYHFKAEARRLLGSTVPLTSSMRTGPAQMPHFDATVVPFPTLLSHSAPNLQDLLDGAKTATCAPPPPPPPPPRHRDGPPPSSTAAARSPCTAAANMAVPSAPEVQAVPVMAPLRSQSVVSAGVSPMSRFSGLVSRGVQAASPAVRSPAALSMGWSPPETPRPTGPTGPRPMVSRSPLGDLQTQPGLTAQAAPKLLPPRGVSGQFPDLLYPQGEIMGLGGQSQTASEIVTSVV
ncbi:unnamed protein product [Durusdinium trenchii]|uniref:Uncharacterized protein n=1 Tax=Durusdinium trenchii TaxID=1381693 RepID=A0ABP0Q7G8_9DINO